MPTSVQPDAAHRGPLLTAKEFERICVARECGSLTLTCSVDLGRSLSTLDLGVRDFGWCGRRFAYPERCKERTVYYWTGASFEPVARYASALIKLVPTDWGPPTFEIDGIKMLPTAQISPYAYAQRSVALIQPRGKIVLDTCGGLGYFAACCLTDSATHIMSYEKNPDVIWLRSLNPWSPPESGALTLARADVATAISELLSNSVDAVLHDPPRFAAAGELYSADFYGELARVLKRKGYLFHYTGAPNRLSTGRDLASEVSRRLRRAGFSTNKTEAGLLAVKT